MATKRKAHKVLFSIFLLVIIALLCYFSIVLYVYLSKPNNISAKLSIYNVFPQSSIGNMYLDASYDIIIDDEIYYGVNIDESGYVLTVNSYFYGYDSDEVTLCANDGTYYDGVIVFGDEYFDLVIIKLYDHADHEKELSLPFVSIATDTDYTNAYIAVGCPGDEVNYSSMEVYLVNDVCSTETIDDIQVVETVYVDTLIYSADAMGAVFDKKGNVLGLVIGTMETIFNTYNVATSTSVITYVLDDVIAMNGEVYQSDLVSSVQAYDMVEFDFMIEYQYTSSTKMIYYNGEWITVTDAVLKQYNSGANGVYLTEDLTYNNVTISAGNFITSVNVGGKNFTIATKADLFTAFYSASAGDTIEICALDLNNSAVETEFSLTVI